MHPPHSDAVLGYGYDLGGPGKWHAREVDGYGRLALPWLANEHHFHDDAEARLLASVDWPNIETLDHDTYLRLRADAEQRLGSVEIRPYTTPLGQGYLLATPLVSAVEGTVAVIPTEVLTQDPTVRDRHLSVAVGYLGITPTQPRPEWLLASHERFRR